MQTKIQGRLAVTVAQVSTHADVDADRAKEKQKLNNKRLIKLSLLFLRFSFLTSTPDKDGGKSHFHSREESDDFCFCELGLQQLPSPWVKELFVKA